MAMPPTTDLQSHKPASDKSVRSMLHSLSGEATSRGFLGENELLRKASSLCSYRTTPWRRGEYAMQ